MPPSSSRRRWASSPVRSPAPKGFAGAPVVDPGETASVTVEVDPGAERRFLPMVIPSDDTFVGNDDPLAREVFDAAGAFTGIGPILVMADEVRDAGTEVNDLMGAAFSTAGGEDTDEDGVIAAWGDLGIIVGTPIPPSGSIEGVPAAGEAPASIEIAPPVPVPVPAALPLAAAGLGLLGLLGAGRRTGAAYTRP